VIQNKFMVSLFLAKTSTKQN